MRKTTGWVLLLTFLGHARGQGNYEWVSAGKGTACQFSEKLVFGEEECKAAEGCEVIDLVAKNVTDKASCKRLCQSRKSDCGVDYRDNNRACNLWSPAPKYFRFGKVAADRECFKLVRKAKCAPGSPKRCQATTVLTWGYSAGNVIKITNGLKVANTKDENSCPTGWKIWSPRSRNDWTALDNIFNKKNTNIKYPRKPHLLVDVTRGVDGCGGCAEYPMNNRVDEQSSWQTSDGSAWWLRDTVFNFSSLDSSPPSPSLYDGYKADNYIAIERTDPDDVSFRVVPKGAGQGLMEGLTSTDYLCQPMLAPLTTPATTTEAGGDLLFGFKLKVVIPFAIAVGIAALLLFVVIPVAACCKGCSAEGSRAALSRKNRSIDRKFTELTAKGNNSSRRLSNDPLRRLSNSAHRQLSGSSRASSFGSQASASYRSQNASNRSVGSASYRTQNASNRSVGSASYRTQNASNRSVGSASYRTQNASNRSQLSVGSASYRSEVEDDMAAVTNGIYKHYKVRISKPLGPAVPLSEGRTFIGSNYKKMYNSYKLSGVPFQVDQLMFAVEVVIEKYAEQFEDLDTIGFLKKFNADANTRRSRLKGNVEKTAELFWTSPHCLNETEFCSMLNEAIREDEPECLMHAMVIVCALNRLRVTARGNTGAIADRIFPKNGVSWRGSCLPNEHQQFFTKGTIFRCPAYLATSFRENVALSFITRSDGSNPPCLWRIMVDPRGKSDPLFRCKHASFVGTTQVKGEGEYLFAPYSVFTVESVLWSLDPKVPHRIHLRAALDNSKQSEALPLSPWY